MHKYLYNLEIASCYTISYLTSKGCLKTALLYKHIKWYMQSMPNALSTPYKPLLPLINRATLLRFWSKLPVKNHNALSHSAQIPVTPRFPFHGQCLRNYFLRAQLLVLKKHPRENAHASTVGKVYITNSQCKYLTKEMTYLLLKLALNPSTLSEYEAHGLKYL